MCENCRRELSAAYRWNPNTGGRVPPWEEDCGQEVCESCHELFTPRDDERLCAECERENIADEDGEEDEDEDDG